MNRDKLLLRKFAENADQFGDVIFCRLHKSQLVFRKKINDAPPPAASHRKGWVGAFAIIIGQQAAAGKSSNLLVCSSQPYMQFVGRKLASPAFDAVDCAVQCCFPRSHRHLQPDSIGSGTSNWQLARKQVSKEACRPRSADTHPTSTGREVKSEHFL